MLRVWALSQPEALVLKLRYFWDFGPKAQRFTYLAYSLAQPSHRPIAMGWDVKLELVKGQRLELGNDMRLVQSN